MFSVGDSRQPGVRMSATGHGTAHSGTLISTHLCVCWGADGDGNPIFGFPVQGLAYLTWLWVCASVCARTWRGLPTWPSLRVWCKSSDLPRVPRSPTSNSHAFEFFML